MSLDVAENHKTVQYFIDEDIGLFESEILANQ